MRFKLIKKIIKVLYKITNFYGVFFSIILTRLYHISPCTIMFSHNTELIKTYRHMYVYLITNISFI